MSDRSIAATLFAAEDLRLVERELGPLAPDMVRVRFGAGGICGSDLHYFRHARTGDFAVTEPLVLGHEVAGEIEEVGTGVSRLRPGDRVAVNPSRWCGACPRCREGRPNLCENIFFMGSASKTPHMQGGFASLFDAVPAQCVKVPDTLSFAAAALAEPLAVTLHAVARAGDVAGATTAVFGAGPIGLLTMMAAARAGAGAVTALDVAAAPLEFAARLGARHTLDISGGAAGPENAFDVSFEASGTAAGLAAAVRATRRGGTVVLIGNLPGGQIPAPANAVMAKELDVKGTFRFGREFDEAVRLIADGSIEVERLITGARPLAAAVDAFRLALDRSRSIKVVLTAA